MRYTLYVLLLILGTSCLQAIRTGVVQIKEAPQGDYDLNVLEVTHEPTIIELGEEVTFTAFFDNRGTTTVPKRTFHVELLVNGEQALVDYEPGPVRPNGQSAEESSTLTYQLNDSVGMYRVGFKPDAAGSYHYEFNLDRANDLAESDETNNVAEGNFVVIASDKAGN